jgi:hypothetical protein
MLPANQNIAGASVSIHNVLDAPRIIAVTRDIHGKAQVLGERLDSVIRALTFSACKKR